MSGFERLAELSPTTNNVCCSQSEDMLVPNCKETFGYNSSINSIKENEFSRLKGMVYLDHASATLYAESQVLNFTEDLISNCYGNPHSRNDSSELTEEVVQEVRSRVLQHFNTSNEEYAVVFTSGATAALKLVAETFPWTRDVRRNLDVHRPTSGQVEHKIVSSKDEKQENIESISFDGSLTEAEGIALHDHIEGKSVFCYLTDNHTSVVGMRGIATAMGASCIPVRPEDVKKLSISESVLLQSHSLNQQNPHSAQAIPEALTSDQMTPYEELLSATSDKAHSVDGQKMFSSREYFRKEMSKEPASINWNSNTHHLFCFPAQSNFTGRKYPLNWVQAVQENRFIWSLPPGRWHVLLDAASLVGTSPLDLAQYPADLVTISFYKIFGFPTGLGALLVRRPCWSLLQKAYFGGGTVAAYLPSHDFCVAREGLSDRMEDGTIPFIDIIALRHGFNTLDKLTGGMENVMSHTFYLAQLIYSSLKHLCHYNTQSAIKLYADTDYSDPSTQGPIVAFNVLDPKGKVVGFSQVEKLAKLYGIQLRTGCFCNTGACQAQLGLSDCDIKNNLEAGHVCGDLVDLVNGRPTGAVRISLGYMSTCEDAHAFLNFMANCFVTRSQRAGVVSTTLPYTRPFGSNDLDSSQTETSMSFQKPQKNTRPILTNIFVYPIKSCAPIEVHHWPVGPRGLLYDRTWMAVCDDGSVLGQGREPRLCLVQPELDLHKRLLAVQAPGMRSLVLPLDQSESRCNESSQACRSRICKDRVTWMDCGKEAADWLSEFLGRSSRLVQQDQDSDRNVGALPCADSSRIKNLSLANKAQYLLLNRASAISLLQQIHGWDTDEQSPQKGFTAEALLSRFRGNFIVDEVPAFEEDSWKAVDIGSFKFQMTGGCTRCHMICINQVTAQRTSEPLKTLMSIRGSQATFGVYLLHTSGANTSGELHTGAIVNPHSSQDEATDKSSAFCNDEQ
uniref:molybdenum cofactor sulfurase n=1 Tax=Myxine glutinosa TaxID=7769 RepID=UPI00358FB26D